MQQIRLNYKLQSKDGGIKYSWTLNDNEIIESVFLKFNKKYFGICFSTQAGCKNKCLFCSNSALGFSRNLSINEILQQVIKTLDDNKSRIPKGSLIDLAFMGVGEPLDNSENVYKAIRLFKKKLSKNYKYEYSISTIGNIPEIKKLVKFFPDVKLQISLNSIDQKKRSKLMPGATNQNILALIKVAKYFQKRSLNNVLLNYLLIKGFNDSQKEAVNLARLIKNTGLGIMISHLNSTESNSFLEPATQQNINKFKNILVKNGVKVIDFFSLSSDVDGGCGQLRYIKQRKNRFDKIYNLGIDKTWSDSPIPKEVIKFIKKIKINKNQKILDAGCGRGRLLKYLKDIGFKKIFGIDIAKNALDKIKFNANVKKADAAVKIPFKNNSFDLVFDMTMIGSVSAAKWGSILKEINRVLKPNGFFISEIFKSKSDIPLKIVRKKNNNLDQIFGISKRGYTKIVKLYFDLIDFSTSREASDCEYYLFKNRK